MCKQKGRLNSLFASLMHCSVIALHLGLCFKLLPVERLLHHSFSANRLAGISVLSKPTPAPGANTADVALFGDISW